MKDGLPVNDNDADRLLKPEEIIIAVCGDCPFEGRFTDEDCHACQRNMEGVAKAQRDLTVPKKDAEIEQIKARCKEHWVRHLKIAAKTTAEMLKEKDTEIVELNQSIDYLVEAVEVIADYLEDEGKSDEK